VPDLTGVRDVPQPLGSSYELDALIGRGGMGEVWRGRSKDGRPLAFKLMIPELAQDEALVARFLRERSILTRLDSPYVVQVYDMVAESGRLAIVMQLVDGRDLRAELARMGTFAPAEALRLISLVLRGVAAAHAFGITHRDLKPGNVLVARDQAGVLLPKVSDFGIAAMAEGATRLTGSSAVIGTPIYMAPEQADHGDVGPAADIYSAGIMLYELLAGVPPFTGRPMAVLRAHTERDPGQIPGLPDEVRHLLMGLLAKDPAARFPSALAAADAMDQLGPQLAGIPPLPRLDAPPTSLPSPVPVSTTAYGTTYTGPRPVGAPGYTPTTPVPGQPGGPRSGSRTGLYAGIAAAVVALLVVVAVVVSSASSGNDDGSRTAALSTGQVASPTSGVVESTPEVVATGGSETPREPTVDPTRAAVVRHTGSATLREGNSIDLDSHADNWDQNSTAGAASPDLQLSYGGSSISTYSYGASFVPVATGSPVAYQTCTAATGYTDSIGTSSIDEKISFCALTDNNRYSYIKIVSAEPAEYGGYASVVLNITTFELQVRPTPTS
jgi:serine/threonine-protein kinase